MTAPGDAGERAEGGPDLGDLVVVLLASTLAGLRERLLEDGYDDAAELVADLADLADAYLARADVGRRDEDP